MDVTEQLARVDPTTVTAVAQQAIGSPTAQVVGGSTRSRMADMAWRWDKLPAADQRLGDRRMSIRALVRLPQVDARAACRRASALDLTHNEYWRREIATYESEIPAQLPGTA